MASKKFKGTQGEWKIDDISSTNETAISCNGLRIAEVKHYDFETLPDPSHKEGKANAKIISKAPKLLKALQRVVEEFSHYKEMAQGTSKAGAIFDAEEVINESI